MYIYIDITYIYCICIYLIYIYIFVYICLYVYIYISMVINLQSSLSTSRMWPKMMVHVRMRPWRILSMESPSRNFAKKSLEKWDHFNNGKISFQTVFVSVAIWKTLGLLRWHVKDRFIDDKVVKWWNYTTSWRFNDFEPIFKYAALKQFNDSLHVGYPYELFHWHCLKSWYQMVPGRWKSTPVAAKKSPRKIWMRKMNPNTRRRGMKKPKMLGMNGPKTNCNTVAITLTPTIVENG